MMSEMTVVIPQFNCWELTVACCSSLWRHHCGSIPIIVVDDGSDEHNRSRAKRFLGSQVRWIEQKHAGVTAAWNAGMRCVETDQFVLLNNDALTLASWLAEFGRLLDREQPILCGTEIRTDLHLKQGQRRGRYDLSCELLAGWCWGGKTADWYEVGEFDESMSLYWSDTDWQLRWMQHFGVGAESLLTLPSGKIVHQGHESTSLLVNRSRIWHKDWERFQRKCMCGVVCSS